MSYSLTDKDVYVLVWEDKPLWNRPKYHFNNIAAVKAFLDATAIPDPAVFVKALITLFKRDT